MSAKENARGRAAALAVSHQTEAHPQPEPDYYFDDKTGLLVMTAAYLRRRGYCCGNGCRHCPYPKKR